MQTEAFFKKIGSKTQVFKSKKLINKLQKTKFLVFEGFYRPCNW